ncbi:MAG: DUF2892 domain-containing protein [Planctomycetales bacterium]|nr:DUF2892 domain-containing protein [Planctomycetales bacterium]
MLLPTTVERVPKHTDPEVNDHIRSVTQENVDRYANASQSAVERRVTELNAEWDIERTLEANAATIILMGLGLGRFVDRRFYLLPAAVAGFLLQHALQGWCPPLPVFRRLGVRTQPEIEAERHALLARHAHGRDSTSRVRFPGAQQ